MKTELPKLYSVCSRPIVFYNSLSHTRTTLIRVYVTEPHVEVTDTEGNVLSSQTDPYWLQDTTISLTTYKVRVQRTGGGEGGGGSPLNTVELWD